MVEIDKKKGDLEKESEEIGNKVKKILEEKFLLMKSLNIEGKPGVEGLKLILQNLKD